MNNSAVAPVFFATIIALGPASVSAQAPADALVLEAAVLPLPTSMQADAGVWRLEPDGHRTVLRRSENGFSCMYSAAAQERDRFDVRCYSDELWPAILRGWEVFEASGSFEDRNARIHSEIEAGSLSIPMHPTAGYRMLGPGSDFDWDTGQAGAEIRKWQSIHFPFRTAEEMGLTEDEELSEPGLPGQMPYVMASGTWWAHVMIVHRGFD